MVGWSVTLVWISVLSASLSPNKASSVEVDKVADKVADMVAEMVADMEVDKMADMEVDLGMVADIDINMEIQFGERVGHGGWLIGPKIFRPSCEW